MPGDDTLKVALEEEAPKDFLLGCHRLVPPEKTVERVSPYLGRFGITRIANVTGLDRLGIPVVNVVRPNSRSLAVSQGKGKTLTAATASGLMEAVELYHAETIDKPLLLGSCEKLSVRHCLADVEQLALARGHRYHPAMPILWIEGYDLILRESIWVPYDLVSTDSTMPPLPGSALFSSTSNGLASGNHLLEAISHGICEVVERDAAALWYLRHRDEQSKTRMDLSSVNQKDCREILERCYAAGLEVVVWDITSDVGIPSFLCLLAELDEERSRYASLGMGCHPAKHIGLLRAMTEAAQSRLTLIAGSRDDVFREEYEWSHFDPEDLEHYRYLRPEQGKERTFDEVPSSEDWSFRKDLDWELEKLRSVGIERVIVVDLTDPELGLPVVRIVVPGLEGPRLACDYRPGIRARRLMETGL